MWLVFFFFFFLLLLLLLLLCYVCVWISVGEIVMPQLGVMCVDLSWEDCDAQFD